MLTWDERRNWLIGLLAAAVGGFLTGYNVGYVPWATEINPFSALHVTGEWYAVAKILLAFVLFPLVGYTTRYLSDRPARYESAAVALVLLVDAWGNILFANYDALSVAHEVATPLLAATVATTAVCAALVFTPELRRLTRRVRERHGRTMRRAALPTVAVLAVVALSLTGGFGGVAAQNATDELWNTSTAASGDSVHYNNGQIYVGNDDDIAILSENGTIVENVTFNKGWGEYVRGTGGDTVYASDISGGGVAKIDVSTGSVIEGGSQGGYVTQDGSFLAYDSVRKLNATLDTIWSVSVNGRQSDAERYQEYIYTSGDDLVSKWSDTSPVSPENTTASDVRVWDVSVAVDRISVTNEGVFAVSQSSGKVYKISHSGSVEWNATTSSDPNSATYVAAGRELVYTNGPDRVEAWHVSNGSKEFEIGATTGPLATNSTALYVGGNEIVEAYATGVTPTQQGITGNVFECPSADTDCTNNPYGPGVGPDALVQVRDTDDGTFIEEANTTANGEYTLQNITQDDIYNVEVYVGGNKRYDEKIGLSPTQGVGRNATVPMRTPSLSDYSPVDDATLDTANITLSANLSDTDFPSDNVTVEWFNAANDNKIGEETLSGDGTASTTWEVNQSGNYGYYATATDKYNYTNIYVSETRTFEVTQEAVSPWELVPSSASPSNDEYVTTSHTHSIDLANLNESNVRVRFYDGDGTQIGADTVSGNGTKTASISHSVGGPGNYAWYVVAEDQDTGVTRSSSTFRYKVAGGLRVRDATTGDLINDRTVTAEFTVAGDVYNVQVSDGRIDYATDLPIVPAGNFIADIDAAGYYGTSLNIYDAANLQQVYLQKEGTETPISDPDGDFDVSISDSNEPVQASETATVDVTATNNIGSSQSGVLTLYVDGDKVDYKSIQQQGNQQKVHTLSWVPTTSGNKNVVVESGTDSASMNFNVNAAPSPAGNFSVDILGSNSPVDEDQTLNVDVNVTDRTGGGTSGTLVGTIDGGNETVATTTVSLNASESKNVTLSWTTDLDSAGTYDFVAESGCTDAACSDNTTVEVNDVEDVEGVPEEDILNVLFTLEDRTGDFTPVSNTTLIVQRRINSTWNEVESGKFGAANQYQASLIRNEPYNLVVRKNNRIRDIGGFRTNVSGEFELVINARSYPTDQERPWRWNATYVEDADQIKFSYKDEANATNVLELDIYEYGNSSNYLFRKVVNDTLGTYEYSQVLTANQSKNRWVVSFCATRDGEEVCREEVVGSGVGDIFSDAPDWLLEMFGALSILFVAGIFSTVNAKVGAIVTLSFAGLLYAVGVMASALTGIAIAVALAIAVVYKAGDSQI